jgi:hypothetical protein
MIKAILFSARPSMVDTGPTRSRMAETNACGTESGTRLFEIIVIRFHTLLLCPSDLPPDPRRSHYEKNSHTIAPYMAERSEIAVHLCPLWVKSRHSARAKKQPKGTDRASKERGSLPDFLTVMAARGHERNTVLGFGAGIVRAATARPRPPAAIQSVSLPRRNLALNSAGFMVTPRLPALPAVSGYLDFAVPPSPGVPYIFALSCAVMVRARDSSQF